ncbi:DUF2971 domain-containing protein [Aeromonas veronii]
MRKLYKYYSKLDLIDFTNPSFKLASAHTLNDPFERILSREMLEYCEENMDKDDKSYRMFKRILGESASIKNSYDTLLKQCGVVSLSETQHNLLMWAHYADQHKGICIGYNSNVLENVTFPDFYKLPLTQKPLKVNYDIKKTFEYEYDIDFKNQNTLMKSILTKVLTMKGDDWIYEKEHRFIIPLNIADRRMTFKDGQRIERVFHKEHKQRRTEKIKLLRLDYNKACDPAYSYLLDIDPKYITDVYLGCRMEKSKAIEIRDHILKSKETKHIKVHKFKENPERFELIPDVEFFM